MSDNGGSETGAFLAGFIIGGLVGAATALILAPQSGEQTCSQIREKGIELRDRAGEMAEDARLRAEEAAVEARKRADELERRAKELYEEQRTRVTGAVEEGKKAALRKRDELMGGGKAEKAEPTA